jgi:hypothetical protein
MNKATAIYTWDYARPGDSADAVTASVTAGQLARYAALFQSARLPLQTDAAPPVVPMVLVRIFAPLRRHELVMRRGALYPDHPTPAVTWKCRMLEPVRVGDPVVSVTRLHDKFVKRDRHFLEWRVDARRPDGQPVAEFSYVNLWDQGRSEDRTR